MCVNVRVDVCFDVANDPTELDKEKHFIIFTLFLGNKRKTQIKNRRKKLIFF